MIIHKYGEWEEPEKPPFTLEDIIRAATEMMMRMHISFNEALRYLLEQGLPLNQFLRYEGMDNLLDSYIAEVNLLLDEMRRRYNLYEFIHKQNTRLDTIARKLKSELESRPSLLDALESARRNRSVSGFYNLRWRARSDKSLDKNIDLDKLLRQAMEQAEFIETAESFYERYGRYFTGSHEPDKRSAGGLFRKYEALENLRQQLEEAKERGNVFGVDEDTLREILGAEAYQEFSKVREEMLDQIARLLDGTRQVTREEDGIFKLTPAAARKVGDRTLRQIFESLKIDGAGSHVTGKTGEGNVEMVKTKPYEFGDAITHMDVPGTMINALIRGGAELPIKLQVEDMLIHETSGVARTAITVMIDMSGSMSRFGRFYNAKKMALALDALVRQQYPEDSVSFVGFSTFARRIGVGEILRLGPEPITFAGGAVNMRVDMSRVDDPRNELAHVPRYFTNMQKGMELSRRILSAEAGRNKEIILITDGAPTAFYEGQYLNLTYPPQERGFRATLKEVRACTDVGIKINVFLLGSDFDTGFFGEDGFVMRMMKICHGRLFHPQPDSLTQYVLYDYVTSKKKLIEI